MDRRTMLIAASAGLTLPALVGKVMAAPETKEGSAAYVKATLMLGTMSKKASQLAEEKASDPHVKEFARFEVAEQTAVAQVLTDKVDPPPPELTAEMNSMLGKLKEASGAAFDKDYIKAQIDGHEKLLTAQEDFLKSSGMTSDHGHIARLAKAVITMHLTMLHGLEKSVG